jgi:amidase
MSDELHFQSITTLARQYRANERTSVEVTRHMLDRIADQDPHLRAYATLMADSALHEAEQADAEMKSGQYRGPLHGVPIALKDLCATNGVPTMAGCAVHRDNITDFDATVVTRLQAAGAVLLGKLNLTEGAMGGYNPALAFPENPWGKGRFPGASSSGSGAATAAGLAFGTLGSDTGGSIRYPAAACGTVGLKPTWGRVSRHGVMDLAPSLDHVGPLTRSTEDAAIMLTAIAGPDPMDPTSLDEPCPAFSNIFRDPATMTRTSLAGVTIGFDPDYASTDLTDDYAATINQQLSVFESLGISVQEVRMPARLREYLEAWGVLCSAEAANAHRANYPSRADEYGPWFRGWLQMGAAFSAADYAAAHHLRLACNADVRRTMAGIDALLFPGSAQVAHPVTPESMWGPVSSRDKSWHSRFTVPFDFNGYPTLSLPCGLSPENLPYSVQLAAHPQMESVLVQLGSAFEASTDFHTLHPPDWT